MARHPGYIVLLRPGRRRSGDRTIVPHPLFAARKKRTDLLDREIDLHIVVDLAQFDRRKLGMALHASFGVGEG